MVRKITEILSDCNLKFNSNRNEYRGRCWNREFHDNAFNNADGSKSMFLSTAGNWYHCFSCKIHGKLIPYLTAARGVPFMEAHEIVSVENVDYLFRDKEQRKGFELNEIIPIAPPKAFLDRGFYARILRMFKVGGEDDHIFIPILDNDGVEIVAMKHRVDRKFWYVPENFNKGEYLYNFHRCKGKKWCVLVEGETDVYRSCQNGIWNVAGIVGGTLTDEQAELIIEENFDYVVTAFDNDKAGFLNTETAFIKLGTSVPVRIAPYDAEDPGKCGAEEWLKAIANAEDYIAYAMAMEKELGEEYNAIRKQARKTANKRKQ